MKKRWKSDDFDDDIDEEDEDWDEEDGEESYAGTEVTGPSFAPMFTGLLKASGEPILRHPVVMKLGFHPERDKYHCPTLEEEEYPGGDCVVGWVYD